MGFVLSFIKIRDQPLGRQVCLTMPFSDIAKTAQSRKVRIIITEWSISKPDYGLPKSHRVNLVRDVLTASKEYNIPIIYNGLLGGDGLSSTTDNKRRPSHDFDEKILKEFSVVNF